MALYIHIPFCKQACSYCNFHFSTNLKLKAPLLEAISRELEMRAAELKGQRLESIYFGGGTPSLMTATDLNKVFDIIEANYNIASDAEITLEANPDDLTEEKVRSLRNSPVNRLSIGIQSFFEDELRYMNRAHSVQEGLEAIDRIISAGFDLWTMDLIYGTPFLTPERWQESLELVVKIGAPHLSAYQLTIEPSTALAYQISNKSSPSPDDEATVDQFKMLMDWAESSGYEHYEISNLARPGMRARHNSGYWKGTPYLGIGPSAHSFNSNQRSWNIANNARYIKAVAETGTAIEDIEVLSRVDIFNEYVMTGLRTIEGISIEKVRNMGSDLEQSFKENIKSFIHSGQIVFDEDHWKLTREGKLFADRIASGLFIVNE